MSKAKITKYFKLQREMDDLDSKEKELRDLQDDIFKSKFKRLGIACDADGIFDVFLNNPDREFDKWDAISRTQWSFSQESLRENINKIFKVLYDEEFIVRTSRGFYTLNPEYVSTVKRNKKENEDA